MTKGSPWAGLDQGKLRLLGGLGALGALLILAPGWLRPAAPAAAVTVRPVPTTSSGATDAIGRSEADLVRALEGSLGEIQGAGRVRVTLTLAAAPGLSLAQNENRRQTVTNQTDSGGQSQVTKETQDSNEVVLKGGDGGLNEPVVVGESGPRVSGVLVVAEGASDPTVREELSEAARTVLGIPAYEVMVVPMRREKP